MTSKIRCMAAGWAALLLALALPACQEERSETPTKGRVTVAVSEDVAPLIRQEEQKFEELYSTAHVELLEVQTREAIARLFNDTITMIVSSRPLNDEERAVASKYSLTFQQYKIAIDGIAVIVDSTNPVTRLRTTQLDSLFRGLITRWEAVGGAPGAVVLLVPGKNSGVYEIFQQKVLHGAAFAEGIGTLQSSQEMLDYVARTPSSVGLVGVNWLRGVNAAGIKVLELQDPSAPDSLGIRGQYFTPHQAHLYRWFYPLTREVYIYSRAEQYGVGAGFVTFITSVVGQKIVLNSGLVPATMPVRLVELTQRRVTP